MSCERYFSNHGHDFSTMNTFCLGRKTNFKSIFRIQLEEKLLLACWLCHVNYTQAPG